MTHGLSFPEHLQTVLGTILEHNSNQVPPNTTQNSLPNPVVVHANSFNSAAAATPNSAAAFRATKLDATRSVNNEVDAVQIYPISLQLGDNKLGDDNPSIFLSVETLKKFKKKCSSEGFKKLFTGELQLDSYPRCLWFLKILSMANCTDDFKETLNDCYHLERFKIDETTFDGLLDLALDLGLQKITKTLLDSKDNVINKDVSVIYDENKEIIFNTRPSPDAIGMLALYSETLEKELSKPEIGLGPLFNEILYDVGFLNPENPSDQKLKKAFDNSGVKKRGPYKCIALMKEAKRWGLEDLERKYLEELNSVNVQALSKAKVQEQDYTRLATIAEKSAAVTASSIVSITATPEAASANNQDEVQIRPILLPIGDLSPSILLSVRTLEKLKKHCSPEGFKKLFTDELQLKSNPLCYLKILSMADPDCTEDFKDILIDCYHLERCIIDETIFEGLLDLALNLGIETVTKSLVKDKEKMIGKKLSIISDKTIETIFNTRPSIKACRQLGKYSDSDIVKIELSKSAPNLTCLFEELLYDAGCLDLNNPNDQKLKEAIDELKRNRGPFKIMALISEARDWGLKKLEKRYQDGLRSGILNELRKASHKFDKQHTESSIFYCLSSMHKVASFLFKIFPEDAELSTAYNNYFEVYLRDLISFPLTFNNIVLLIRNSPIKKLDFSGLNLNAQNLYLLSQIESLKTVKIQECSSITSSEIAVFKTLKEDVEVILEQSDANALAQNQVMVKESSNTKEKENSLKTIITNTTFSDGTAVGVTEEFLQKCGEKHDYVLKICKNNLVEKEIGISRLDFLSILKDSDEEMTSHQLEEINAKKLEEADYSRLKTAAEKLGLETPAKYYELKIIDQYLI